jgi:hypothetical protein
MPPGVFPEPGTLSVPVHWLPAADRVGDLIPRPYRADKEEIGNPEAKRRQTDIWQVFEMGRCQEEVSVISERNDSHREACIAPTMTELLENVVP